jgi:hypothetical protein
VRRRPFESPGVLRRPSWDGTVSSMVADSHSCTVTTPSVCLTQDLASASSVPPSGRAVASSTLGKRPLGNGVSQASRRRSRIAAAASAAGAAELHQVAGDRSDLVAEIAGLALGAAEGKGKEYLGRGQAIADLCRMAVADESLIPQWRQVGRERAAMAVRPPFRQPR